LRSSVRVRGRAFRAAGVGAKPLRPVRRTSTYYTSIVWELQGHETFLSSVCATIGTPFVLLLATSTTVALALVVPLPRRLASFEAPVRILAGLGEVGIGAGALAGLLVSGYTSPFGFTESGYRATSVPSIVLEAAASVLLDASLSTAPPVWKCRERGVDATPLRRAA
jgi:hypothetical protein